MKIRTLMTYLILLTTSSLFAMNESEQRLFQFIDGGHSFEHVSEVDRLLKLEGDDAVDIEVRRPELGNITALIAAAMNRVHPVSARMIQTLLHYGANHSAVDSDNRSALYHAVVMHNLEAVQHLVAAGADIDLSDRFGQSPRTLVSRVLHRTGGLEIQAIFDSIASPEDRIVAYTGLASLRRSSPLPEEIRSHIYSFLIRLPQLQRLDEATQRLFYLAITAWMPREVDEISRLINSNEANVNAINLAGYTALIAAIQFHQSVGGRTAVVRTLLDASEDIYQATPSGLTAFQAEREGPAGSFRPGHRPIAELLQAAQRQNRERAINSHQNHFENEVTHHSYSRLCSNLSQRSVLIAVFLLVMSYIAMNHMPEIASK